MHASPAAARNRGAILEVLRRWLPEPGRVLEVGCGTGQHAAYLARALPHLDWQPSDRDEALFGSVAAWAREEGVDAANPPLRLDVTTDAWPPGPFEAVFSANLIHIAPWEACCGLVRGAGAVLRPGGLLVLYGPFRVGGVHTAPSNEAFDRSLRERDPRFGVRDRERVEEEAARAGLRLAQEARMPANNFMLGFRKLADPRTGAARGVPQVRRK